MNHFLPEKKDIPDAEPNYGSLFLWCFELYCLATMGVAPVDVAKIDAGYVFRIIGQPVFWRTQLIGLIGFVLWKVVQKITERYRGLENAPQMSVVWSLMVAILLQFMMVPMFFADIRIVKSNLNGAYIPWYGQALLFGIACLTIQRILISRLVKSLVPARKVPQIISKTD